MDASTIYLVNKHMNHIRITNIHVASQTYKYRYSTAYISRIRKSVQLAMLVNQSCSYSILILNSSNWTFRAWLSLCDYLFRPFDRSTHLISVCANYILKAKPERIIYSFDLTKFNGKLVLVVQSHVVYSLCKTQRQI